MLLIVFSITLQCKSSEAATNTPSHEILDCTWDSITFTVTFTQDSSYNEVSLSCPGDSNEYRKFNANMYSKGTYTVTFNNLKHISSRYYITVYYGNNEFTYFGFTTMDVLAGKHVYFDLDYRWTFDAEFFANFKMAYVLYENDGNFRIELGNKIITKYSDVIDYYYSVSDGAYTKSIGANPMKYSNDGLTYMFLNGIKEFGSWYQVSAAFKFFVAEPYTSKISIERFLNTIGYYTGESFSNKFANYYGEEYDFVVQYFADNN